MTAYCHKDNDTEGKQEWKNIREGDARRYSLQRTRTHELHQLANDPGGPCGLEELRQFQAVLAPTYQLLVMCRWRPFSLIYKGPACPLQIRLIKAIMMAAPPSRNS